MTRFARATGSKGSNDKRPEEASSWQDMKAQMLAKNEVKTSGMNTSDTEADADIPTAEEITSVWAELVSESNANKSTKAKKKKTKSANDGSSEATNLLDKNNKRKLVATNETGSNQNKKIKGNADSPTGEMNNEVQKKQKKNKVKQRLGDNNVQEPSVSKKNTRQANTSIEAVKKSKKAKITKESSEENMCQGPIASKKKKKKTDLLEESSINKQKKNKPSTKFPDANIKESFAPDNNEKNRSIEKIGANGLIIAEPKPKEKKRRKEELKPSEVLINGQPVQLAPFDGFVVQADDAERLKNLRQSMKAKGIPEAERERAIKLERRRAEKALARLKKKVCFHCRGSGHNLSECPEVQEDQRSTGICYKCGSTEHTHYQCRITKSDDYRFADCFICKEQGHISKQCPDNPRGLYPRGGACASCGDVTHLKKDCPKYLAEKEDDAVTIGTRNNGALEALDEDYQVQPTIHKSLSKKPKQHVKF